MRVAANEPPKITMKAWLSTNIRRSPPIKINVRSTPAPAARPIAVAISIENSELEREPTVPQSGVHTIPIAFKAGYRGEPPRAAPGPLIPLDYFAIPWARQARRVRLPGQRELRYARCHNADERGVPVGRIRRM